MKSLIITAMGYDRPGIVLEISKVISTYGGNVEESRMAKMGSDFAIIMMVTIPGDNQKMVIKSLQLIPNLDIRTKLTNSVKNANFQEYNIVLHGADNEGIVNVLSSYLAENSINILEMNTNLTPAPITGTLLFNLNAIIALPSNINTESINIDFNTLSKKLGVDLILEKCL